MITAFFFVVYASALVFLAASIARAVLYARQPMHLRWELYPVPHEAPERAAHGGSYFEEGDWWTKPHRFNLWGEVAAMVPEMLFLRGLWEYNRKLWYRSFPFHFGLYLVIASGALTLVSLVLPFGAVLHYGYAATGVVGSILVVLGAAALLHRRLTDPELKIYTTPGDVLNLALFIGTFGTLLAGYAFKGGSSIPNLTRAILSWNTSIEIPGVLLAGLTLAAVLTAYIPLTHMSHFIAKYFTYHSVRWDDQPVARRLELQRKLAAYLTLKPTWSAPHMGADGSKTWADVATTNPWSGVKK